MDNVISFQQIVKKSTAQVINRLINSQDETEVTVALQALTNLTLRIATNEVRTRKIDSFSCFGLFVNVMALVY